MRTITVALVEPQQIFMHGVRRVLDAASEIRVVGTAETGAGGIELIQRMAPEVAIIALQTEDVDGVDVLREVKDTFGTRILILTSETSEDRVYDCMMLGAQGYLFKFGVSDLAESVRRIHRGEIVMCEGSLRALISAGRQRYIVRAAPDTSLLTAREREILELLAQGNDQRQVAAQLYLSPATVKTHLHNAYKKLGVNKVAHAVQRATSLGLIDCARVPL